MIGELLPVVMPDKRNNKMYNSNVVRTSPIKRRWNFNRIALFKKRHGF